MQTLWIAYLDTDHLPICSGSPQATHLIEATAPIADIGANTLIVQTGTVSAIRLSTAVTVCELPPDMPKFEDRILEPTQRRARAAFRTQINAQSGGSQLPEQAAALIFAVEEAGQLRFYHQTETTEREMVALFVAETKANLPEADALLRFNKALDTLRPVFAEKAPLLGTRRAYLQWRPDMELERKFTFLDIPDTWALESALFAELYGGHYSGYYPEPHMGIQLFDYENHIFEVSAPASEQGYISFIPQIDGLVTVKRKWFQKNAELRRETLWPGECLDVAALNKAAHDRVDGELTALPPFRRKRLDVNYESLETGHIYGVYFDICTTVGATVPQRFGQVEVEYCRTRSLHPLVDVRPEFEMLADHVNAFLKAHDVNFQHDLYSKLDFVRDCAARQGV
ncbi:MAG: hypothetical protein GQ535_03540 [Rhodobacteraceae bacterium]|nr:hypothetical protein [Paracoccaceae bacterium]